MTKATHSKKIIIPAGAAISAPFSLAGYRVTGIVVPAAWLAANLTFQTSPGATPEFLDIYDQAGAEYTVTATPGKFISLGLQLDYDMGSSCPLSNMDSVRIRSGSSAAPVDQTSEQVISLLLKELSQ